MGLFDNIRRNGSSASTPDEASETETEPLTSVTGEEYLIDPVESVYEAGEETKVKVPSDSPERKHDVYAGERVRRAIEESYGDPTSPMWIGYQVSARQGFTCPGLPLEKMFLHNILVGTTGAGKSVQEMNMMVQLAYAGYGFIYFDPEAKDSRKLLKKIPEHRLDDVVWIEPGNPEFDRTISINFLDVPDCDTEEALDHAIKGRLQVLQAIFDNEDYWGVNMRTITNSIGRAMMQHNHECDDTDDYYTIIDFYFILLNGQRREEFADSVDDPFLSFVHEIADMDDDEVRPMLKRIIEWVQSYVVRKIVVARESSIDFEEVLDDNKIVIVRTPTTDDEIKQMVTLGTMRPIWHAVQRNRHQGMSTPFFAFFDESDKVLNDRLQLDDMLARARAMKLSVTLSCQHLSQLQENGVWDDIKNLCNNPIYFTVPDKEDGNTLMKRFRGYTGTDLVDMEPHHIWTKIPYVDGDGSDTVKLNTCAPMPDLRDDEAVNAAIRASLEQYGTEPITDAEIQAKLKFGDLSEALDGHTGELDMETEYCRNLALKAVYDQSIRAGSPGGFVRVENVLDRLQRYLPEGDTLTDTRKAWRSVVQKLPDAYRSHRKNDADEREVRADDTSFMNVGESENDGADEHWEIMADAYVPFTQLGFIVDIPAQTGDAMPDALATLDDQLTLDSVTDPGTITERVLTFREKHPLLTRLAGAKDAYIESECTTGDSQPSQTVQNLAQAHNEDHRCLFLAREEVAERVYNTVERAPFCCRSSHPVDGERRFYTGTTTLSIEGGTMTRPGASENVWIHDQQTGQYVLRDTEGTEYARFDTAAEIFTDASAYPDEGDRNIKPPVIPEYELNTDAWSDVERDIIVVPEPETDDGEKDLLTPSDLTLYRDEEPNVPLTEILDDDTDQPPANGKEADDETSRDALPDGIEEMF